MDELENFKRSIDLVQYAAEQGYQVSRHETSRGSVVMRHPGTDDKIIVRKEKDGHYVYFSPRDDRDNGTIVDFIQRRQGKTLGHVRQELRRFAGTPRPNLHVPEYKRKLEAVEVDRNAVAQLYAAFPQPETSRYLNGRGIRPETLQSDVFRGTWREDERGNAIFPHRDAEGLSGFERKGQLTGFAAGGVKALWVSNFRRDDARLVLTESAIDAMSYFQLNGGERTRFMSVGGALSPHQQELLGRAVAKMPERSTLTLAFDNDEGGHKLAQQVEALARAVAPTLTIERAVPSLGKDWNDQLKLQERDYIRTVRRAVGRGAELAR